MKRMFPTETEFFYFHLNSSLIMTNNVLIFNELFIESKWKYSKWNFKNKFVYLLDEICWKRKMRHILSGIFWEILEQSTCWQSLRTFPFSTNCSSNPNGNIRSEILQFWICLFVGWNLLKKKDEAWYSQAYSERYWSRARVDEASERSHFQRIVRQI